MEMQPREIYSRLTNGLIQQLTKILNQCPYQRQTPFDGTVGGKETQPFYETQNVHYRVHSSSTPDTVAQVAVCSQKNKN